MKTEIAKMKEMCKAMIDTIDRIEELDTETRFEDLEIGDWFTVENRIGVFPKTPHIKVPLMGWGAVRANAINIKTGHPLHFKETDIINKIEKEI